MFNLLAMKKSLLEQTSAKMTFSKKKVSFQQGQNLDPDKNRQDL
jgi:hypothetical protein